MTSNQKPLSDWDIKYINLAKVVSEWSKDPKSQVGAVVVTSEGGAIALGYNGFPSGIEDDSRLNRKYLKNDMIIHAEQNALLIAGSRAKGALLYVWGKSICARCAAVIIQAGIEGVIATNPEDEPTTKWRRLGKRAVKMFNEVDMEITFYNPISYNGTAA